MTPKSVVSCGHCGKELSKTGDYAYCNGCSAGFHLDDCSVNVQTWKKMSKTAQEAWRCVSCKTVTRKGSSSSLQNPNQHQNVTEESEVSSIGISKEILSKVTNLLTMKLQLDTIEKAMEFTASKYDELLNLVKTLSEENNQLKKKVEILERKEAESRVLTEELEAEIADLNQYGRRCNLEIQGLTVVGDPRSENMEQVLDSVASKIGVQFRREEVHKAHRLQPRNDGKPATIIVQFFSREVRDEWIQAGKRARIQGVYFNENICAYFKNLLKDTKIKARACNYSYVWWRSGKIMVRRTEGDRDVLVIKSKKDLAKLKSN